MEGENSDSRLNTHLPLGRDHRRKGLQVHVEMLLLSTFRHLLLVTAFGHLDILFLLVN